MASCCTCPAWGSTRPPGRTRPVHRSCACTGSRPQGLRRQKSRIPGSTVRGHPIQRYPIPDMALIVHKYGGTSMGSTERIRNVAKRVAKWVRAGHQLVVVPSAMSGETNRLLGLAKELSDRADPRELDVIAS